MGAVGFLYEALKDVCKWYKLEKKKYIPYFLEIGVLSLQKDDKPKAISATALEKMMGVKSGN